MRPYTICHMCTSIDGKILSNRWAGVAGSDLFETTADTFGIGAWVVGNTTMKEFAGKPMRLPRAKEVTGYDDHVAAPKAKSFAIGADAKGVLRFQESESDGDHIVLLVTRQVSKDYLQHLRDAGCSYLVCGNKEIDLPLAMTKVREKLGIKKLMLEGGGKFNGSMLHEGLVDEISQVIVPVADGGYGVSGIFDIPGKPPKHAAAKLRLMSTKKLKGGVIWLRYKVAQHLCD